MKDIFFRSGVFYYSGFNYRMATICSLNFMGQWGAAGFNLGHKVY
jgi:hypothetical protein